MGPKTPAELTERVRFDRRTDADDGYGNTKGAWATFIESRRAKLHPTRGGEQVIAARLQGVSAWDCWVRFDPQTRRLTTDDRVVDARDETKTFAIRFVGDLAGDKTWLFLQLEAGVADG